MCQRLSYTESWEGPRRKAEVKTGLGKTRCPGLQGGLWKRMRYGSRTEAHREIDGDATGPYDCLRATFLSRLIERGGVFTKHRTIDRLPETGDIVDDSESATGSFIIVR